VRRRFSRQNEKEAILAEKKDTRKQNPIQRYFRETLGELKKVSWPTRREAIQLTGIVLAVMVVMAILLGLTDYAAEGILKLILGV
jgi:preprotein translocase subunit SecE